MEVLSPNLKGKEVSKMTNYEILDLVISIIGLVLSAVIVGITIGKRIIATSSYFQFLLVAILQK